MEPKLDLIGLVVEDMARTLAFYRDLGLDIPAEADTAPHVEVALPGGMRLAWDPVSTILQFDDSYVAPTGSARVGLAFLCASPAEVDAVYGRMTGLGHTGHKEPWDAFWGQRYAMLLDPDGNGVDLFAALPA